MSQNFNPIVWPGPNGSLNVRRSIFVYEAARMQASAVNAPVIPEPWHDRDKAFREQFEEIISRYCAMETLPTPEEAHQSWWDKYVEMGWTYGEVRDPIAKTHPDMIPFDQLGPEEQIKDAVFLAFVDIARFSIREF